MFSSRLPRLPPAADPRFVAAHLIPDNGDRDNDKVYFFFTEKATEEGDREGAMHTRVGRVCAVRAFAACFHVEMDQEARHIIFLVLLLFVYSGNV